MHIKLADMDESFITIHITSKLWYWGVWMISTLYVSGTRNATPPPLPEWRGWWYRQKSYGQMSARQADVSDADSHVSVKAKMSMCLDNIRSERAPDLWWRDLRFVVTKRMFWNVFGPGFIETSRARRRMIDSINDGLLRDCVYNCTCVHRKLEFSKKLIYILLLMNISECLHVL